MTLFQAISLGLLGSSAMYLINGRVDWAIGCTALAMWLLLFQISASVRK